MRGLVFFFALLATTAAHADVEGWLVVEARLPVYLRANHTHKLSLRLQTDFRVAERARGLQQALMRFGLIWEPRPWLAFASQTNANLQSGDGTTYNQEWRQEIETQATVPLAPWLTLAHRHRFELRWVNRVFSVRHRIMTRVSFPVSEPIHPFMFNELFVLGAPDFVNQHRLVGGIVWRARKNVHAEFGYVWRVRSTSATAWAHDHGPRIAITFVPTYEGEIGGDGGSE